MMKKKKIIIISILVISVLVGISTSVYLYQNTAKSTIKKVATIDDLDAGKYLTDNFLEEMENAPSNKEFLDEGVKDYEVKKSVLSVTTERKSETEVKATVIIKTTTKNYKTGFEVITKDTYEALMIRDGLTWKIDSYELLNSATIK